MSKEPTLAECVDYMRVLMRRSDPLQMTEPERAALSRAIEVCERVQRKDVKAFDAYVASDNGPGYEWDIWSAALAWARGDR